MEPNQFVQLLKHVEPNLEKDGFTVNWRAVAEAITAPEFSKLILKKDARYILNCHSSANGKFRSCDFPGVYTFEETQALLKNKSNACDYSVEEYKPEKSS